MKHSAVERQYSIAWFKISECVLRGEKERALGVYRLLAHSLDDAPLVLQLEGDILLACGDMRAADTYRKAAELYEKEGRFLQALAVYEHVLLLNPHDHVLRMRVVDVYVTQKNSVYAPQHACILFVELLKNGKMDVVVSLLEKIQPLLVDAECIELYLQMIQGAVHAKGIDQALLERALQHIVILLPTSSAALVEHFFIKLRDISQTLYAKAEQYRSDL